jgi:hypothetical protein
MRKIWEARFNQFDNLLSTGLPIGRQLNKTK